MIAKRWFTYEFPIFATFFLNRSNLRIMRTLVIVSIAIFCLAFFFVQTEAVPQLQIVDLMNKFGGQDSLLRTMTSLMSLYTSLTQEFETLIRQGKSVNQAVPELIKLLPSMMS
ncbi:uncharacterized protein LOC117231030 [Bombus vosnesenskii]|uniref:Uncharacterized protein LOC117231030 n=1 Tax=Bombus vosnesenskii TaxID=207650 RepID=A0A6J3JXV9_9HYME|nr:uncharacterized protein LOC117231030 [Bombus vosnesenskii]